MKKTIAMLLALVMVLSLCACKDNSMKKVSGVWKYVGENKDYAAMVGDVYNYLYEDGTADRFSGIGGKVGSFAWKMEDGYMVYDDGDKLLVQDDCMYNRQGGLEYKKISDDTSLPISDVRDW